MVGVMKGPQFEFSADIPRRPELVVQRVNAARLTVTLTVCRVTRDIPLLCQLAHSEAETKESLK